MRYVVYLGLIVPLTLQIMHKLSVRRLVGVFDAFFKSYQSTMKIEIRSFLTFSVTAKLLRLMPRLHLTFLTTRNETGRL